MTDYSGTIRRAVRTGQPPLVRSLERGLRILGEFSSRETLLSGSELARRLGMPRTTVFHLLQTLESFGVLERSGNARGYRLGVAVLRLGFESLSPLDLTDFTQPVLDKLRDATRLTSHVVIREGRDVVFVAKAQSRAPLFSLVKINVGTRLPAHATVHGQVLMGDMTLRELAALFPEGELKQYTPRTPRSVEALYEVVRKIAQRRHAVSRSSFEDGISVIAAPVLDESGRIAAAVAVTMPQAETGSSDSESGLIEQVCKAASDLSLWLSFRPRARSPARA
ncbi:IclR family transcriptional regulator [Paraburkholderia caballeronis]|uniref:DNA-binding transcriptional regulator, IclR family n=1 Tax=Paraburkholderia caballeronis TaxID=416943 RepID=A0A1H7QBP8_9BURK|nr:IclR family transcriptional regulator [Paraburkholderia caballeronis]PXW16385.1 IclR family transcriptional regulator [Paraburkholderia caballeronis]PXW94062.1 IclR family transcriptional regulator [Paraburkholderia caballeronis]RAJ89126.1 IclR family transcriptional regulator [Paraburkholderia caballeronis]SEE10151.1 transcriptional regulator, IclR family [Paraburkholderia caballeronis]SEL45393.1 DNA-binding transcriptional regulator, IclR family [Paraburkholderia caballeronis]